MTAPIVFGLGLGSGAVVGVPVFLELAKFGKGAAEDEVRLGSGAVHGFLLLFGSFVGGADNLEGERLFESIIGSEFGHEGGEGVGVFVFFSVTDEIVGGEETEFEAVARGFGFCSHP